MDMTPDCQACINDRVITGYFWNGKLRTYVDHRLAKVDYDEACKLAQSGDQIPVFE